ncbi:hypothetical protein BD560DRAFT_403795 [Blakeslea trispora]|nr:hypothetical protein BD560DRAFT_403795 [Blakeslea trispora]
MSTAAIIKPIHHKNAGTSIPNMIALNKQDPIASKSHSKQLTKFNKKPEEHGKEKNNKKNHVSPPQKKNAAKKPSASAPTTPQQRRTVLPVKQRRAERRREVKSMTDAALSLDLEISSTESDDSCSDMQQKKPLSHIRNESGILDKKNNPKKKKQAPFLQPATTTVATVVSVSTTLIKKREPQRNRRRSSSAVDFRNSATVYAGPTFNNAPIPSALPLPVFSPSHSQAPVAVDLEQHSKDLLSLLSHPQPIQPQHIYHHQHYYHPHYQRSFEQDLSEIQRDLRSFIQICTLLFLYSLSPFFPPSSTPLSLCSLFD